MKTPTTTPAEALFSLLPPIFRDCTCPVVVRYDLSTPFVSGEFVYATNARVIVRLPATAEIKQAFAAIPVENRRIGKPESIFVGDYSATPIAVPKFSGLPPCKACKGAGNLPERHCPECRGSGKVTCPCCDTTGDCGECDGGGTIGAGPCDGCGGLGREWDDRKSETLPAGDRVGHEVMAVMERHHAVVYPPVTEEKAPAYRFTVGAVDGRFTTNSLG
jgi:hypothetical protein